MDVSMLSTWNRECRIYIVFCISKVAQRIVLDGSTLKEWSDDNNTLLLRLTLPGSADLF